MKKHIFVLVVLFTVVVSLNAAPTYSGGADGYIVVPSLDVPSKKRVGIGVNYMGLEQNKLTPMINFVPYKKKNLGFEIGSSIDLIFDNDPIVSPLLASAKLQFAKPTAIGVLVEIPLKDTMKFCLSPYLAFEAQFKIAKLGSGRATIGVGYTFSDELSEDINFHAGFYQSLSIEKVALVVDFMNYPYHHSGHGMGNQDEKRAIINIGIRIIPHKRFSIDVSGVDLMDGSRGINAGLNIYI